MTSLPQPAAPSPIVPSPRAEALYFRGLDLMAGGDSAAAAAMFRECLALDPGFLDAHHGLIRALQDAGELDEAMSAAEALIALDPEDVLAHTRLSILYQVKGMVPEAETEAMRAKLLGWKQELRKARAQPALGDSAKP